MKFDRKVGHKAGAHDRNVDWIGWAIASYIAH